MKKKENKVISDLLFESGNLNKNQREKIKTKELRFKITKQEYEIVTQEEQFLFKKNKGRYVLFNIKDLMFFDKSIQKYLIVQLKNEIKKMINELTISPKEILVIGIGNKNLLSDCLGDKVVERIFATRHLKKQKLLDENFSSVSCYSCSVFGKTGIESFDVVKKLCEIVNADLVILVDTFVASETKRLSKSLQICSCGLTPGAGLNNYRKGIDKDNLKVPVISIGVPLLISGQTFCNKISVKNKLLGNLVVMDKEIEKYVKYFAEIISQAINLSLHKNISLKRIEDLMY